MSTLTLDFDKLETHKGLTTTQRMLIKKIFLLSLNEGFCYASNKGLAEMTGLSASGVSKAVGRLDKLGFIKRVVTKENGNERHMTLSKMCIDLFKKTDDSSRNKGNNIKPKNPKTKPETPKPEPKKPSTPKPKQEQVKFNVSEEVKVALQDKLGLQANKIVEDLEKSKGAKEVLECIEYLYQTQVIAKNKTINTTSYLETTLNNGSHKTFKKQYSKPVREEMKPDYIETNNKDWKEKNEREQQEFENKINSLCKTEDEKMERLNLLMVIGFGKTINGKIPTDCTLQELRDYVYGLNN